MQQQQKHVEQKKIWLHYNTFLSLIHIYNNSFVFEIKKKVFAPTIKPESDNDMSGTETGIQFDKFAIISLSCSIFEQQKKEIILLNKFECNVEQQSFLS